MKRLLFLVTILISFNVLAHPVGFSKSYTISSMQQGEDYSNLIHYSPSYKYSFGYADMEMNNLKHRGLYLGYLLKRWNLPKAQGNSYVFGSIGDNTYRYGFQADYETRKIYTLFKHNYIKNASDEFSNSIYRVGYAPYEGDYSELNTWIIVEYNRHMRTATPILRFFYKNILWEMGYNSSRKMTTFNIILRDYF